MISSAARFCAQEARSYCFVISPKSQVIPARFRKHSKVVLLGLRSADAKCSDLLNPSSTPQSSANMIDAPSIDKCSFLAIINSIFFRTCPVGPPPCPPALYPYRPVCLCTSSSITLSLLPVLYSLAATMRPQLHSWPLGMSPQPYTRP